MVVTMLVIAAAAAAGWIAAGVFAATRNKDVARAYSILAKGVDEFLENPCTDRDEDTGVRVAARKLTELREARKETAPAFQTPA